MEDPKSAVIRTQIFEWLQQKTIEYDDVLPYHEIKTGFTYGGNPVPLLGPQGIFKPKIIQYYPISITTSPNSPYSDKISENSTISYKYRGNNPNFHENVRLKEAMKNKVPLIYFHGVIKGKYLAQFPVYIAGADDRNLTFTVEADAGLNSLWNKMNEDRANDPLYDEVRRRYITSEVVIRLHQQAFREKVLHAYRDHCAFCSLKHRELLDAAHILPDIEGGPASVSNGLSLCKIHHAAFDKNILGINEDLRIEVRQDILEEVDGPMLKYGLQEMNHKAILLPRSAVNKPDRGFIRERYERFLKVG
jgi:putative restriction endonuclease